MHVLVLHTHVSVTKETLLGFAATEQIVSFIVSEWNHLFAESAWFGTHVTPSQSVSIHILLVVIDKAVLAWFFCVSLIVMILFFRFGHYLSARLTLIVASCTSNLMYSKLCRVNLLFTGTALLSRNWHTFLL